jgi:hypothetical protein
MARSVDPEWLAARMYATIGLFPAADPDDPP